MSLARKTLSNLASRLTGRVFMILALIGAGIGLPRLAAAAGGEAPELKFTDSDLWYLYASLGFGVLAIVVGWAISRRIMAMSSGNEKMQEVGRAIKDGALAYLKQQVSTMLYFVAAIAILLYWMYSSRADYDTALKIYISLSFVGGVAASYFAGYAGMLMAVNANTRTAHAALTSFKTTLETAFRAGAVAGLVTVGMGLIGATLIFLLAKEDAMKLLIGFGFGGSLAALFMRVGGGIFTKAADVGADLVGKVEAGIPEDDARNPATIADNVGDNVGDCAGMAADIFESYEVTLVAAIILGAATATMFEQEMWMRLILFALMARGVGIVASILGIFMVKGSDDIDKDPLRLIRRGFNWSAVAAVIGSGLLAYFMMGGSDPDKAIVSSRLTSAEEQLYDEYRTIMRARERLAKEEGVPRYEVSAEDILDDDEVDIIDMPENQALQQIAGLLQADEDLIPPGPDMRGFHRIDFGDPSNPVLDYASLADPDPLNPAPPTYISFKTKYENTEFKLFRISTTTDPNGGMGGVAPPQTEEVTYGPADAEQFRTEIENANESADQTLQRNREATLSPEDLDGDGQPDSPVIQPVRRITILDEYSLALYANDKGDVRAGVEAGPGDIALLRVNPYPLTNITFFRETADRMNQLQLEAATGTVATLPAERSAGLALVEHKKAEWWKFALCILFGVGMAFVFERLTDYYVSLRGRPVKDVADVSTAGPAPMIITGFAYGLESSVFSILAIVAALIMPMMPGIGFPPGEYGGYLLSFYGIALVGLGLLTTTGFILAMDTFGPISDNAQGIFEMSGAGAENPEASRAVQRLDAAGNTTKALTKGFAIATAVVAAVALFHAYVEEGQLMTVGMRLEVPEIFLGLLIGGATPFLFSAFAINAVGRGAFELINEVRAQFRNDPGIMAGTSKPDYGRCVALVTKAAQRELLGPGILAIAFPLLVAFGFAIGKDSTFINGVEYNLVGAQALGGFLVGAILSGQLMAVLLANSGGIWDNAKKLIEDGLHGGKGSEAHKAGIVVDTVGDPFKDTAGPALNPLIKVMNLVALLLVPIVIQPRDDGVLIAITLTAAAALAFSIWWSKRATMSEGLMAAQSDDGG